MTLQEQTKEVTVTVKIIAPIDMSDVEVRAMVGRLLAAPDYPLHPLPDDLPPQAVVPD